MDDDVFSAAVLEKLPLADSVWRLLHFTMDDSWLDDLWKRKRGRCYERDLKFSTLAHLIADALLEHGGSGHQAFERAREAEILPVSITSAYEKLGNLPVPLSETLLEEGTQRMNAVLPEIPAVDPLAGLLGGLRSLRRRRQGDQACQTAAQAVARLAGGHPRARASVGLNLRTGLAVAMVGHLDGEAGEAALTEALLPKLAELAGRGSRGWWCWTDSTAT